MPMDIPGIYVTRSRATSDAIRNGTQALATFENDSPVIPQAV